jgi:hypothetical protein
VKVAWREIRIEWISFEMTNLTAIQVIIWWLNLDRIDIVGKPYFYSLSHRFTIAGLLLLPGRLCS